MKKRKTLTGLSYDERKARSRERNREHARRTRARKKALLLTLQNRVTTLRDECAQLEQAVACCVSASILLAIAQDRLLPRSPPAVHERRRRFSSEDLAAALNETDSPVQEHRLLAFDDDNDDEDEEGGDGGVSSGGGDDGVPPSPGSNRGGLAVDEDEHSATFDEDGDEPPPLRARRAAPRDATTARSWEDGDDDDDDEDSETEWAAVGTKIHWKNGYVLQRDGTRRDLTPEELISMRRARNRRHAKMTRDRKKLHIETLSRAVADYEAESLSLRSTLSSHLNDATFEPSRYLPKLGIAASQTIYT